MTNTFELTDTHRKEARRFIKFATVGTCGAITHFTIVNVLMQLFGFSLLAANPFGFITAVIQNFTLNRLWTFPESQTRSRRTQLPQFALVSLIGLGINQLVVLIVHHFGKPLWINAVGNANLGNTLSANFALAFAIGIVLTWNFTANRLWTYRGL